MNAEPDDILSEIDRTNDQISRIKDSIRLYRIAHPETEDPVLTSALEYWEERKRAAERALSQMSR